MRVDCETWIYTTVKESSNTVSSQKNSSVSDGRLNSSERSASFKTSDGIVIEQQIQLDQQLYSDGSSDSEESVKKSPVITKIVNDKGLDINFELVNGSFKKLKMFEPDVSIDSIGNDSITSEDQHSPKIYKNQISIPINHSLSSSPYSYYLNGSPPNNSILDSNDNNNNTSWQSLQMLLSNCTDTFTFRQAILIIEECIKLENYINSECQVNELKELYFSNQKQIIDYLNKSLKKKLFSLSRSTELFSQQKKELICVLEAKLSSFNLNQVIKSFEFLEYEYYELVESIKSSLKLKIAKLEKNLEVWNDFDKLCCNLNEILENGVDEKSNLEYRSLLIQVSSCLNSLKEFHSQLSSTCSESRYFEMKNLIIVYEVKFSRLREEMEVEAAKQEFQLKYFTKSNEQEENELIDQINNENYITETDDNNNLYDTHYKYQSPVFNQFSNQNPNELRNRKQHLIADNNNNYKVDTKTPATEKQTNRPRYTMKNQLINREHNEQTTLSPMFTKVETSDKSTFTVNEISTQTDQFVSNRFNFNTEHVHHFESKSLTKNSASKNLTETDGKKLLLEAYLRNNDNLVHNDNSQTESSQTGSSCLLSNIKASQKRKSLTTTGTRESGIGTYIDDEIATSSCDLEFVKATDRKQNDYQLTDNERLSNLNDNSSTNEPYVSKTKANKSKSHKSSKRNESMKQLAISKCENFIETSHDSLTKPKDTSKVESNKTGWFSWLFKTLFTFFLFFLTIIFVIFVYFFYSLVLFPKCCDYQRNYLMFNIS